MLIQNCSILKNLLNSKTKSVKYIVVFYLFYILILANANAQTFVWAKAMGGSNSDYSAAVAVDAAGNVYTTGYFIGTADFNPGAGVSNFTSLGLSDVFISKLDAAGNFIWAKRLGGISWNDGSKLALDAAGNIYILGNFFGTVDFDPGAGTANLTSAGDYDMFVCKLDAAGNYVWAKRIGNANGDYIWAIDFDAAGNIYTAGNFYGTVDFNPNAGVFNLSSGVSQAFFFSKWDNAGNFLWAKSIAGTNINIGYAIVVDAIGNEYITGGYSNTIDFDPGVGVFNLTSVGSQDIFVMKLDATGHFVWAKSMGGTNYDGGISIEMDNATGNIYTTGTFSGTADFNPGIGVANITSSAFYDIYISKLDAAGNFIWAKSFAGSDYEYSYHINLDALGNVYTCGCFPGTVDFDPGAGVFNLSPLGIQDIFIAKLNSAGNFVWAKAMRGSNNVGCAISLSIDAFDNIYTTGFFSNTVDFNPDAGIFNLTAVGDADIFVHKMALGNTPLPIELISFYGKKDKAKNVLYWTTASETNNDYFTLLKSTDGINFEPIAKIESSGNSTQASDYIFEDEHPLPEINYYQLQQTDINGQSSVSKTIAINNSANANNQLIVTTNPANNFLQLSFTSSENIFQVEIIDALGKVFLYKENKNEIDISTLFTGIYFVRVKVGNEFFTQKFVKR